MQPDATTVLKDDHRAVPATWAALMLAAVACSSSSPPSPAEVPAQSVDVGRRCEAVRERLKPGAAPAFTFFEVVNVREPLAPGSFRAERTVRTNHVAWLMLEGNGAVEGPWSICADAACSSTRDGTVSVRMTRAPLEPSAPIEFELVIASEAAPAARRTLQTRDQEPIAAELPAAAGGGTLLITPYYLADRNGPSGRALLDCKLGKNHRDPSAMP